MSDVPAQTDKASDAHMPTAPARASGKRFDLVEMRGGLISTFTRHKTAANLLMVLLIIGGLAAISRINAQVFPSVEVSSITITIGWPGASPEDVVENILANVEPSLRFLDGVEDITSYGREGSASIRLELAPGTNRNEALDRVEQAINGISTLPDNAETPRYSAPRWFDNIARIAVSGPFPESALRLYAQTIRNDLLELGIDQVNYTGFRDRELVVQLNERDLRRLGLTVSDVAAAIRQNTTDRPSGTLEGAVERQLRVISNSIDAQTLRDLPLKASANGDILRLREVGTVRAAFNADQLQGLSAGETAIQMTIQRSADADTLEVAALLESYIAQLRPSLPQSLSVQLYDVRSDRLQERILLLVKNGAGGLALVLIILFVFLNARTAFWVAVGIPVAMLITIGVLYLLGETINMLSLFALIMMLGIIVDDAIVVAEHTETRFSDGEPAFTAAENGAKRMFTPVMAAALTTMAAFAPILLMEGRFGAFMAVLPIVVLAVLVASLIECFLILPGHLSHAMNADNRGRWSHWRVVLLALSLMAAALISLSLPSSMAGQVLGALTQGFNTPFLILAISATAMALAALLEWGLTRLTRPRANRIGFANHMRNGIDGTLAAFRDGPFKKLAEWAYAGRYITLALTISAFILALGMVQSNRLGFTFFPSPEAESIRAAVEFNAGISEQDALDGLKLIESKLFEVERDLAAPGALVQSSFLTLGSSGRGGRGDNLASFRIELTASEARNVRTPDIIRAWRQAIPALPGLKRFAISQFRGGPGGQDIDIRLKGSDPNVLKDAAAAVIALLNAFPGVSGAEDDLAYGKPELVMQLTERGSALGFSVDAVGVQIRNAFEGTVPKRFADGEDEVSIRILASRDNAGSSALRSLELRAPSGVFVPLSEVVSISERQGFSVIQRRNGATTISVTADVDSDITNTNAILLELEESELEAIATRFGVDYRLAGSAEDQQRSFGDLRMGTLLALAVIYIILAWVFSSYTRPLIVMMIIPFGFVGTVVGHMVLGFDLTVLSMIGLLGLSGILVNNSIILVSRLEERLSHGETSRQAAVGASQDRLRAVLLTSLSTIGGLSPLLFETSLQAQFLMPMAITIVFGLAFATVLVLFLVPALVGISDDLARLRRAIYAPALS